MDLNKIYDKAEGMAEQNLCKKDCLCPGWKEKGFCCDCSVFFGLREYYKELLEEQEKERIFEFHKKRLEKGFTYVRFNVIEYQCHFPKIDPYKMAIAIKRDGLPVLFDDTSISVKENLQKERKFMKLYLKEHIPDERN